MMTVPKTLSASIHGIIIPNQHARHSARRPNTTRSEFKYYMMKESNGADYEFFRRIGSPKKVVAPMVEHSDLPFRMQTRKYGAQLVFTQMINSNVLVQCKEYREELLASCEGDRPLIVQIAGDNPQMMLQAARIVESRCDAIDINLGCPQGIAKRGHYGAFLMEELELLHEIISTLVKNISIPITCKTRIYRDADRTLRLCDTLVNAGASMLTIHGRLREEKGHAVGQANWEMIRKIKSHFVSRGLTIPILANGGISNMADYEACLLFTGADGVMTSEAILENPSMFTPQQSLRQVDLTAEYLEFCRKYPVNPPKVIRSHMMKMMHRYFVEHEVLRDLAVVAHTDEEFSRVVELCREQMRAEEEYLQSWYHRHMFFTHAHASRVGPGKTEVEVPGGNSAEKDDIMDCLGAMFE